MLKNPVSKVWDRQKSNDRFKKIVSKPLIDVDCIFSEMKRTLQYR